ncbi:MAG: tetratricopeptide repeat protein [Pyrinomonadaceae bacterium]
MKPKKSIWHYPRVKVWVVALVAIMGSIFVAGTVTAQKRRAPRAAAPATAGKTIRIQTAPKATIWIDDLKRGVTDDSGKLEIKQVASRAHVIRVRATGYKEITRPLTPPLPATLTIKMTVPADAAEAAFQSAETAAATAKDDDGRRAAVVFYQKALSLRPRYPEAHVGLARVYSDLNEHDLALDSIDEARDDRPNFSVASTVEGRIWRAFHDDEKAVESFKRAIREARGYQPEAHTGLGLTYEDLSQYEEAAVEFKTAILQLADTEPLVYQLLGSTNEKLEKYKEAVAAYDKYLELAPNGNLAPAVRSVIDQLRRQANGEEPIP